MQLIAMEILKNLQVFSARVQATAMLITREGMPESNNKNTSGTADGDEIPWAAIYHKAREIMMMPDVEFWNTSPRKYFALLNEALIFRGIKKAPEPVQYMDDFL